MKITFDLITFGSLIIDYSSIQINNNFMNSSIFLKFFKFGIVGSSGVLVDYGITFVCKELLKMNKYIANSFGFIAAASTNYYFNRVWTFRSTNPNVTVEYTKFFLIALVGLGLSNSIIWFVSKKTKYDFYIIKGFAIIIVFLWNFGANYLITFK